MITERMHGRLSLGANIRVIISLLLLAFEINQSTKATIAAASNPLYSNLADAPVKCIHHKFTWRLVPLAV